MNELTVFNNEQFGEIRTTVIDGEPWFVGKDVAAALGYKNTSTALQDNVDDADKGVTKVTTLGGTQNATIINESGLYCLVFGSRLESAKAFRRWITSEVIPSIRKTGSYSMQKPMTQLEIIAANAQALVEHERRMLAIEASQKELDRKLTDVATTIATPPADIDLWQIETRKTVNRIVDDNRLNFRDYWQELYAKLEAVAGVNLDTRKSNLKERMAKAGASKVEIGNVSKLQIVARDRKLRPIFDNIVKMEKSKYILAGGSR